MRTPSNAPVLGYYLLRLHIGYWRQAQGRSLIWLVYIGLAPFSTWPKVYCRGGIHISPLITTVVWAEWGGNGHCGYKYPIQCSQRESWKVPSHALRWFSKRHLGTYSLLGFGSATLPQTGTAGRWQKLLEVQPSERFPSWGSSPGDYCRDAQLTKCFNGLDYKTIGKRYCCRRFQDPLCLCVSPAPPAM